MMGVGMQLEIMARRDGTDKLGRPTEILTLDNRSELRLGGVWWERAGKPDVGDLIYITVNMSIRGSEDEIIKLAAQGLDQLVEDLRSSEQTVREKDE